MQPTRLAALTACTALALLPVTAQVAPDAKLIESCADCHGANGVSKAQDVPTIAGVSALVQTDALKAYHGKTRPCPKVSYKSGETQHQGDMCSAAKDLLDSTIADLAGYFAKQPYAAMKQPFDATLAAAGKAVHDRDCKKCHSSGGKDPADDAGILAGQPLGWLNTSITAYRRGDLEQPKKMKDVISKLSDADVAALANYYASEQ